MLTDLLYGQGIAVVARAADGTIHRAARGFTTDTVSYSASLSKQMAGVCAAVLAVDVETPIRDWLPELPSWADPIRVRHLLHHTSGLPGDGELNERIGAPRWDTPSVLQALTECPAPRFPAGSDHVYCNAGYICLATILERHTDTPFADLAHRLLFEPLGMRHTRFCAESSDIPPDAAPAGPTDDESPPLPLSLGDGGAWTTAEDLHRWNEALLPGGTFDDRVRTLVHAPGSLDDGSPLDYAWGVGVSVQNGVLAHSHGGSWPGWAAKAVRLPDLGITFAALSNDDSAARMVELTNRVLDRLKP